MTELILNDINAQQIVQVPIHEQKKSKKSGAVYVEASHPGYLNWRGLGKTAPFLLFPYLISSCGHMGTELLYSSPISEVQPRMAWELAFAGR